jgi:cytochrome b561
MTDRAESAAGERYSLPQIVLHWLVVALVVVQWLTHDAMEKFWDHVEDGEAFGLPADPVALLHFGSGAGILLLMLARIVTRLRYGAPPLPAGLNPFLKLAAHLNHLAFYVLLIALPLSGAMAIFLHFEDAADLHGTLVTLLFVLIAMHIGAVIYHTFIRRDGLIWRMLRSG